MPKNFSLTQFLHGNSRRANLLFFIAGALLTLSFAPFGWYLLAPLLFSEAVSLHPNAIIISVLVFGGLWGFWGLFFAIPLATLAAAVVRAWSRQSIGPPAGDDKREQN